MKFGSKFEVSNLVLGNYNEGSEGNCTLFPQPSSWHNPEKSYQEKCFVEIEWFLDCPYKTDCPYNLFYEEIT